MLKNFLLLLSMLFTSAVAHGYDYPKDPELKYKSDLYSHYYSRDHKTWQDTQTFCERRASWHGQDYSELKDVCFPRRYQAGKDSYGNAYYRWEVTFKSKLKSFSKSTPERLLEAILEFKFSQVFNGFPLQFFEVFGSEGVE